MLELEEALLQMLSRVPVLPPEEVPLAQAADRFAAEEILSPLDLPIFDNSAMDGYAVRSADLAGGAEGVVRLRLLGKVAAGSPATCAVEPGGCVRLFTGSPLPAGADAVVMQEDVTQENEGTIRVLDPVKPWENVRLKGEDVRSGAVLARAGERLGLGRISLLAAVGVGRVRVHRRPKVGVLATGSELCEPGEVLEPGKIYESNRSGLSLLLRRMGLEPRVYGVVKDDLAQTGRQLRQALDECDAVVTSGGVSVGEFDQVKTAFAALSGELAFWKVAIKPGKPFVFGQWEGKSLFGLPGNPVSALVTFWVLVRPVLLHMQGARGVEQPEVTLCQLSETLSNPGDRRHFMRVHLDGMGKASGAGIQASHILSSLALSNGLVEVPPRTVLAAGSLVPVRRWD